MCCVVINEHECRVNGEFDACRLVIALKTIILYCSSNLVQYVRSPGNYVKDPVKYPPTSEAA